jgi:hypothetical protein
MTILKLDLHFHELLRLIALASTYQQLSRQQFREDVCPPAPREVDDGHELVGELEGAPAVDDDASEWMAAALDPDGCLEEVVFLARQTTERYNARGIGAQ